MNETQGLVLSKGSVLTISFNNTRWRFMVMDAWIDPDTGKWAADLAPDPEQPSPG